MSSVVPQVILRWVSLLFKMTVLKKKHALVLISCFVYFQSTAQDIFTGYEHLFTPPLQYTAYRINDALLVDGKMDEKDWEKAPWSVYFSDIEGAKKTAARF